ncbi:MAG: DUF2723 domain-containing protein [Anaerolineales bacterium]|nr:DUF2723 domain-containing protein [Anaerolineales bacterium]
MNPTVERRYSLWTDLLIASLVGLAALLVYALTLTPSLSYLSPDGSELATVPYVLGLAHSPGYPLYTWLGFLFAHLLPLGDVAHRINLMSAVMGALGVGGLYLVAILVLPAPLSSVKRACAALGALLFAFSLDFWSQAVIAEVYAPNAGMLALTLLALLAWERSRHWICFFAFGLLFGLSLGTHLSNLGFAPAFALFILLTIFTTPVRQTSAADPVSKRWLKWLHEILALLIAGASAFALGALQFAWLPLRAATLNDRFMLRNAPTTLAGLYNYTLGAFPNFKFAFPLPALPDRLVIYLDLLRQQFGLPGIGLGIAGLFALLFYRPRHFFLLVGMYLVNVWFFIQYSAFDLEVFFIPAHMLWAIFMAFGAWIAWQGLRAAFAWLSPGLSLPNILGYALLLASVAALSLAPLAGNWEHNDFSSDTAINDFYANVWQLLPQEAALVTQSGVFGYDAFYWQLVYDTRPDVLLPTLPTPNPSSKALRGRQLYATTRALENRGPGALPPDLLSQELWQVPILLGEQPNSRAGGRDSLVLYHLSPSAPSLVATQPNPQVKLDANLGAATLVGVDLIPGNVESGATIQITLYWRLNAPQRLRVEISLGEQTLEQHEVGFGLLERYAKEIGLPEDAVILERYDLVIPSTTPTGEWPLALSRAGLSGKGEQTIVLGELTVTNELETMQRWLQIARPAPGAP